MKGKKEMELEACVFKTLQSPLVLGRKSTPSTAFMLLTSISQSHSFLLIEPTGHFFEGLLSTAFRCMYLLFWNFLSALA